MSKQRIIGGYFELELPSHLELHSGAIALNGGRFCLEYILRCHKYSKVYVPYFTCDSVLEPITRVGAKYIFYHIDEEYRLAEDIILAEHEALIYTNYWGLHSIYCHELAVKYGKQLILDCTQAFYATPIQGIDTFYSCRKFFGVPDGGYLYTNAVADFEIEQDISYERMTSLTKRIDLSPEEGYNDFRHSSEMFHTLPMRKMSKLTRRIMCSIDYEQIAERRRSNYEILLRWLGGKELSAYDVPMIFPYRAKDGAELRKHLIDNKIFVAKYWPNVQVWVGKESVEAQISDNIIPLPIDQRYNATDMEHILETIYEYEE